jgi:hypothetical protein
MLQYREHFSYHYGGELLNPDFDDDGADLIDLIQQHRVIGTAPEPMQSHYPNNHYHYHIGWFKEEPDKYIDNRPYRPSWKLYRKWQRQRKG